MVYTSTNSTFKGSCILCRLSSALRAVPRPWSVHEYCRRRGLRSCPLHLATPWMVALMENAAVNATDACHSAEGEGTVGTHLDILTTPPLPSA